MKHSVIKYLPCKEDLNFCLFRKYSVQGLRCDLYANYRNVFTVRRSNRNSRPQATWYSLTSGACYHCHLATQVRIKLCSAARCAGVRLAMTTELWLKKPGRTGRDLPLRAPLIPFPGWDPGDQIYNENGAFLLFLDCFSAIAMVPTSYIYLPATILYLLASRIVRQANDSPESPLSICALQLAVSLIL